MGLYGQCPDCGQAKAACPVCQGLGRLGSGRFRCRKCEGHGGRCPDAVSPGTDCGRPVPGRGASAGDSPAATSPGSREAASNPLQHLIRQRLRERGWSYGEVARRGGLPRSTVYTLAATKNLARPPRPATLDGLAKGLEVPVSVVRAAAAESTGLNYYDEVPAGREHPGDPERVLLIASIDELTPEDRRHVAVLVESLRARASGEPADG